MSCPPTSCAAAFPRSAPLPGPRTPAEFYPVIWPDTVLRILLRASLEGGPQGGPNRSPKGGLFMNHRVVHEQSGPAFRKRTAPVQAREPAETGVGGYDLGSGGQLCGSQVFSYN